ncbi:hypothetical protein OG607_44580 [Streptomyces sp. NBC_01537]|uniref:hypothetical protein n=1 Tax=Streptomyces sp. NBC_01537 TaxID=2903896 RepID=UPI0038632650
MRGFAVMRDCSATSRIGPLYADSAEVAAALVGGVSAATPGRSVGIDVPDINTAAARWRNGSARDRPSRPRACTTARPRRSTNPASTALRASNWAASSAGVPLPSATVWTPS